ncbi:ABC transporter ATP-binding protein [Muricauda sp. MAR_2010_75]|uniref:ABC transporter ATP-binding protein n=1 Tax=Allomuricauda sp. MAR_2010_75 TaxID=1250232 RepID=UPI00068C59FD|nr:ABC transporter ATP-binding protein [Muricauda sp. MAR_2010_75]
MITTAPIIKEDSLENPKVEEVIQVRNVFKHYSGTMVLNDVSFTLRKGEILGILGPNGAGKTTLLETIEGLRHLEKGEIRVLGYDQRRQSKEIQNQLGIQLQKTSLFDRLSVRENLHLYSRLYGQKHKINDLLEEVGLLQHAKTMAKDLSGGQFQKLKLCLALLNNPKILFLDEPSTGLDPTARSTVWKRIRELKQKGCSIIMTTHYMEEAHELCERIIILHDGKLVANNSPENLINQLGYPRKIILKFKERLLPSFWNGFHAKNVGDEIVISTHDYSNDLRKILEMTSQQNKTINSIRIQEANLEDVYLELTQQVFKHNNILL